MRYIRGEVSYGLRGKGRLSLGVSLGVKLTYGEVVHLRVGAIATEELDSSAFVAFESRVVHRRVADSTIVADL